MKYLVYAKILGEFFPKRSTKIGECIIKKQNTDFMHEDISVTKAFDKSGYKHMLSKSLNNMVFKYQSPPLLRYMESDYVITTEVSALSPYDAVERAEDRFRAVVASLSLAVKTTTRSLGKRRIKRDRLYDYQMFAVFVKSKGNFVQVEFPKPLLSQHNYFPEIAPRGFMKRSKEYLSIHDPVFQKGLIYLERAWCHYQGDDWSNTQVILNYLKCIELICISVRKKRKKEFTKDWFEDIGNSLGVPQKEIASVRKAWDARNSGDVAHTSSSFYGFPNVDVSKLERAAVEYLLKYSKQKTLG